MRRFIGIFAILLISGCTISDQGITPFWMQKRTNKPVVVEPKKVTTHELYRLVIEDVDKRHTLPRSQLAMLTAKNFRDFLKANCAKDSKGNPQFRFVNKDTELTGIWAEMKARSTTTTLPKLLMQNGDAWLDEPLPDKWEKLKADADPIAGVK